jgi:hypothetical protein
MASWAQIAGTQQPVVKPRWYDTLDKYKQQNAVASHMQCVVRPTPNPGEYSYYTNKHSKHGGSNLFTPTCGGKPQLVKRGAIVIPVHNILVICRICLNRCILPDNTVREHCICENCRDLTCTKAFDPAIVENFKNFKEFMKKNLPLHWVTTVKGGFLHCDMLPTTLEELQENCRCILCR